MDKNLKFRGKVWAGKNVGVVVIDKVFKARELDELIWQEFRKREMVVP